MECNSGQTLKKRRQLRRLSRLRSRATPKATRSSNIKPVQSSVYVCDNAQEFQSRLIRSDKHELLHFRLCFRDAMKHLSFSKFLINWWASLESSLTSLRTTASDVTTISRTAMIKMERQHKHWMHLGYVVTGFFLAVICFLVSLTEEWPRFKLSDFDLKFIPFILLAKTLSSHHTEIQWWHVNKGKNLTRILW